MSKTSSFLVSNLRFLMEKRGLNPNSLAEQLGNKPPQATIFRILNGESLTPRDDTVLPLATFFGVSLEQLRYVDLPKHATNWEENRKLQGEVQRRVLTIMDETGATAAQLAEAAGIPEITVADWIQGSSVKIPLEAAVGIQEKYGYNVVWVSLGKGEKKIPGIHHADPFNPIPFPAGKRIPVLGMAQLGDNGFWAEVEYPVGHGDGYLDFPSRDHDAYGIRCIGDSMLPRIKDGEFVVIEPNHPVENGDEVLVKAKDGR
ncbi:MAG: hypothetical protein OSB38_30450, partial [Paraburkholderia fungorum]|nr:hypothetical protein [Paraburkholderia fungorum]